MAFFALIVLTAGFNACGGSNSPTEPVLPTPTPTAIPATPTPTPVATAVPTPTKTPTPVPTLTPTPPAGNPDSVSLVSMYPPDGATLYVTQYGYFKISYVNAGNHPNATLAAFFSQDGTTRLPTIQLYNMVGNGAGISSASSTLRYSSETVTNWVILVLYDRVADPGALRPFASLAVPVRYNWSMLVG